MQRIRLFFTSLSPAKTGSVSSSSSWSVALRILLIACIAAIPCAMLFSGYVKDDAYIAFRYARNFVDGLGLVFNPGERVEGYTDFLWVMLSALVQPLDPGDGSLILVVTRIVGVASAVALSAAAMSMARHFGARGSLTADVWAAVAGVVVATHPAVAIWSMSGLEPVPFAALTAWAVDRAVAGRLRASFWIALAASLLRPEGLAVFGFAVLAGFLVIQARDGSVAAVKSILRVMVVPMIALALYHAGRYAWFGTLVPNTFRVKSSSGHAVYAGFEAVVAAALPGAGRALLLAGLLAAFILRRRVLVAVVAFAFWFFAYLWWVGGDEMRFGRLVISAWPFLAASGAAALAMLSQFFGKTKAGRIAVIFMAVAAGGCGVGLNLAEQLRLAPTLAPYRQRMDASQRALGEYLEARLPSGALVAYQDMGLCPWAASDIRFLDLIGLVSSEVADLRDLHGVRMRGEDVDDRHQATLARERFKSDLRDLVFSKRPEAIVLQAEIPEGSAGDMLSRAHELSASELLPYCSGSYSAGLGSDARLQEKYHLDRVFPREPKVIFVVLVRNDVADRRHD